MNLATVASYHAVLQLTEEIQNILKTDTQFEKLSALLERRTQLIIKLIAESLQEEQLKLINNLINIRNDEAQLLIPYQARLSEVKKTLLEMQKINLYEQSLD